MKSSTIRKLWVPPLAVTKKQPRLKLASYFLFWEGLFSHVLISLFFKSEISYLLIVFYMDF